MVEGQRCWVRFDFDMMMILDVLNKDEYVDFVFVVYVVWYHLISSRLASRLELYHPIETQDVRYARFYPDFKFNSSTSHCNAMHARFIHVF